MAKLQRWELTAVAAEGCEQQTGVSSTFFSSRFRVELEQTYSPRSAYLLTYRFELCRFN